MRAPASCLLVVLLALCAACARGDPISTVEGMMTRLLGSAWVGKFNVSLINADKSTGHDVFEIQTYPNNHVELRGNNGVALASALNWYLKYSCNSQVSWGVNNTGVQISLPSPLPNTYPQGMSMASPVKYRYYMNVCTVSYSAAWWDWERWEWEIDWMALNGVNLPLAFTGQEYVWRSLWRQLGLTADETQDYFSGAAFLAWTRMGNLRNWAGPLTDNWIDMQMKLQLQILERVRAFGMTSVLPGFSGRVPQAISRIFPQANVSQLNDWNGFKGNYCCDFFIQPNDPTFLKIGSLFIQELIKVYGTDHVYNADTFNEMRPPTNSTTYLHDSSAFVYHAMAQADPKAIWLMQGWLFVNERDFWNDVTIPAYLSGVPNDSLVILDLFSDARPIYPDTKSYYGKPFVWNMLLNFGGNRGLYGNMSRISTGPLEALAMPGSTMIGTGMTPEAIENNPVMFDLMSEMGWRKTPFDLNTWVGQYATRRYGVNSAVAVQAWTLLHNSVYVKDTIIQGLFTYRPSLTMNVDTSYSNATGLVDAWRLLLSLDAEFKTKPPGTYLYDLVDVSRQVLTNLFYDTYLMFANEYKRFQTNGTDTKAEVSRLGDQLLGMIEDLDTLLSSDPNFLLGRWIASARSWATNSEEGANYEFNARNQITLWGPTGEINDYAAKHWGGLVRGYYLPRWTLFVSRVNISVQTGKPFDDGQYNSDILAWEQAWGRRTDPFPTNPQGDTIAIAKTLLSKYATQHTQYKVATNQDAPQNDLLTPATQTWTKDVAQLTLLCDADPACEGFNSNGYLKRGIGHMITVAGCDFYSKVTETD
eukprot:TRINITY_DN437_c0_g1_i1.p1 TRINITY_DN437_c0_g1~~TRINITY_DN437_c0_g1_i1.p1  ORF type:complete len:814 (-),score=188.09 TRINITY_DN437_c0_g1_i1:60-2501(-)